MIHQLVVLNVGHKKLDTPGIACVDKEELMLGCSHQLVVDVGVEDEGLRVDGARSNLITAPLTEHDALGSIYGVTAALASESV
jgi:hypothetical protein